MKKLMGCMAVVLALSSVAFAGDAKNGAKIYSGKCAACHGKKGEGKTNLGAPLNKGFDAKKFKETILNGKKGKKSNMPSFKKQLKDKEVEDLLSYLESLQPKKK